MENYTSKFDVHGVIVEIAADDPEIIDILSDYLSYFKTVDGNNSDIIFKLEKHGISTYSIPEDAYWFFNYHGIAGLVHDGIYYYVSCGSVFRFDPSKLIVKASVTSELISNRRIFTHMLFTIVLMETLRYQGLYFLHGAGLAGPNGTSLVVTGDGASGKTTLTIALIRLGWRWLTDDTLLLKTGSAGLELFPFWREFHIPAGLAERIEELRFLLDKSAYSPSGTKRSLRGETLYGDLKITSMKSPDVVLFSRIVDSPSSRVEKVKALDAVNEIIRNSPLVLFSQPPAKAHLEALKALVENAVCYRLYSGRDVFEDPTGGVSGILRLIGMD